MEDAIITIQAEIENQKLYIAHYAETAESCRKRAEESEEKKIIAIRRIAVLEDAISLLKNRN